MDWRKGITDGVLMISSNMTSGAYIIGFCSGLALAAIGADTQIRTDGGLGHALAPWVPVSSSCPGCTPSACSLLGAAAGYWDAGGNLSVARVEFLSATLRDGRVLVAGGEVAGVEVATAEIYDPDAGTWAATGSMANAHGYGTASLLVDGRVMVVGLGNNPSNKVDLFNPDSGTWAPGQDTTASAIYDHEATTLANGEVFVTGGYNLLNGAPMTVGTTYRLDGGWEASTGMSAARASHAAVLLADGRVLVAGGTSNGANTVSTVEIFDPTTNGFSGTGNLTTGRRNGAMARLPDGRVLYPGGLLTGTGELATAEIYDPDAGTWSATGSMAQARRDYGLVPRCDGTVMIVGGFLTGTGSLSSVEVYSPDSGTWATAASMAYTHSGRQLGQVVLPDRRVVVIGNLGSGGTKTEVYTP